MKRMKTAVIGCGDISDIYFQNMIHKFSILQVVGCCSLGGVSAKKKAEKYNLKPMTLEEILEDKTIEMVVNLTPPVVHYDIIKRALLAGKHVFTEKVVSADFNEACELKRLAEEQGLRLGVAPDTFLGAGIQTARQAVEQGLIGTVTSCHASLNRDMKMIYPRLAFTRQPGGGVGFDVGIYYLTALLSILGPVDKVSGMIQTNTPRRVVEDPSSPSFGTEYEIQNENLMMATIAFRNGTLGTMHINGDSIFPEAPYVILYGTEGILTIPNPNEFSGKVTLQKKGMETSIELPITFGYGDNSRGIGPAEMAWAIFNDRPHRANIDMACHAVEILNGIVNSSINDISCRMTTTFEKLPGLPPGYMEYYAGTNPECALM